jgi:O-antigen/teichoic acid export membrane protein
MTGTRSLSPSAPIARNPRPTVARREGAGIGEIARGSTLNLVGAVAVVTTTLGMTVLVTRGFSPAVAGAFFTATSLFLILESISGLGADSGLVYFIARLRSTGGSRQIGGMLRSAVVPVAIASSLAAAVLIVFAHPLASAMLAGRARGGTSLGAVADALRVLALALPFAALTDILLGATRGYRDMRPTVVIDRTARSCLQLFAALIAAATGVVALLAPLWALAYVPAAASAWLVLRRIRRRSAAVDEGSEHAGMEQPAPGERFWRFTAPRALAMGAQVIIQRLDIVLVGIMRGPVDAAIYTAATRFLVVCQFGNQAIGMASQPHFSRLFALRDRLGANAIYKATTAWVVLVIWPLCLLAIIYGPTILSVFGNSYSTGSQVMVILGGSMLLASACGNIDVLLISTGRSTLSLANGLIALTVNVGIDLALIPHYGITGAAIGWAAALLAANVIPLLQIRRMVHLHPFGKATFLACGLSATSFGLVPALVRVLLGDGAAALLVSVVAGAAVLAAGLWYWRDAFQLSLLPRVRLSRGGFSPTVVSQKS